MCGWLQRTTRLRLVLSVWTDDCTYRYRVLGSQVVLISLAKTYSSDAHGATIYSSDAHGRMLVELCRYVRLHAMQNSSVHVFFLNLYEGAI